MDMSFIEFVRKFLGIYEPLKTTIYVPIEQVNENGIAYISHYESHDVVASGLASVNVEYIICTIMFLFMMYFMYKFMIFAVVSATGNKRNKQTVKL